ncbi:RHS repeat-associated core domain-containing protein [Methylobacter sp.]|uniref:RHS repeat domain-containing protein n=1 Tax=Methylobacter sp. TaxID=2051955 RepID=UPI0011FFD7D2|nr:RHS repeat-associated core domain-containing protein [Methylobacter sp.]TAK64343.1 MAG: hypothetical protein EPO18_03575 [Methylobacter sp.]
MLSQIGYDPDGQINGWLWGNNQQSERFYDLSGRPVIISMGVDANTQQPNSRTYGYDAAGRLTHAIDDSDPHLNQQHHYDELDRLTGSERGESAQSRTDYSYDLSGNRSTTITGNTSLSNYSIDPNSNRLLSQGGAHTVNYSYDPTGHLTGDGSFNHTYNAAGRRIASTNTATGQTTGYGYNALGQRISKTSGANSSQYFYDEQGHLTGEYDASGQLIQEILWLGDLPVAVLKPATPANPTAEVYYLHIDHLGTPRKITRPNDNKMVWTWEGEAFGNSLPEQNPSGLGNYVFNLRFPGQYYDQETGLFYNGFRDYDPQTGRYIESDPIGLAGGIDTYAYVYNNPLNGTDPLGLIYKTENCKPKQKEKVKNACEVATKKANILGIGDKFQQMLDKATISCTPVAVFEDDCGGNDFSSTIYLNFKKKPGAYSCNLAAAVLHEGSHLPPLKYDEADAFMLEYKAFPFEPRFTPDQFDEAYPHASQKVKSKYKTNYEDLKLQK